MGWNDHLSEGPDPEPIAEHLGLSIEEFESFGDFELTVDEGNDHLVRGYFLCFHDAIPEVYAGGVSGLKDDRTIWLPISVFFGPEPDWDDDDIPFADPQIQQDYEAALGKFMVRFNRIENLVSRLIEQSLQKQNVPRIADHLLKGPLNQRISSLALVFPGPMEIPVKKLTALLQKRNLVAHGHFDQNPYQGDYSIINSKGEKHNLGPSDLEKLCIEADRIWDVLRSFEAYLMFSDA